MPTFGSQLNIAIDPEKREKIKRKARGQGLTVNDLVNQLLDQWLDDDYEENSRKWNPDYAYWCDRFDSLESRLTKLESGGSQDLTLNENQGESLPLIDLIENGNEQSESMPSHIPSAVTVERETEPRSLKTYSDSALSKLIRIKEGTITSWRYRANNGQKPKRPKDYPNLWDNFDISSDGKGWITRA